MQEHCQMLSAHVAPAPAASFMWKVAEPQPKRLQRYQVYLWDKSDEPWICRRCANSPRNFLVLLRMFQNPCPWGRKHYQGVKSNASPSTKETAGTCLPSISLDNWYNFMLLWSASYALQGLGLGISPRLAIDPVAAAILARVPLWQQSLGNFENSVHESLRLKSMKGHWENWENHGENISKV